MKNYLPPVCFLKNLMMMNCKSTFPGLSLNSVTVHARSELFRLAN